ncbi:MAG: hypothetical protein GY953_24320 [bacterium]|nr:hypothetical protein [bacterium]
MPPRPEMELLDFFTSYYSPVCLGDAEVRTFEAYRDALAHWVRICGRRSLSGVTAVVLRQFADGLKATRYRGRSLSVSTVRKHLRHIQAILDRAGPAGPRCRDAAGILQQVPWIRPPREQIQERSPAPVADIARFYRSATQHARLPVLPDVKPAAWWRAVISTICSTSLRIGQVTAIPMAAVDWNASLLRLPASVSRKSKRTETKPLHIVALRALLAVRGDRELILPQPHAKNTIYRELHRLQALVDVPRFAFHCIRRAVLSEFAATSPTAGMKAAGHRSFQTTLNHYVGNQAVIEALDQSDLMRQLGS